MITGFKLNPISGNFDLVSKIPQLNSDPSSPKSEDAWVLKTVAGGGAGSGEPYGLLLSMTQPGAGASTTYQLSYRTQEATTVRALLS